MKRLLPSLREKKRYIVYETKASKLEVERMLKEFLGIWGMSKANPVVLDQKEGNKRILRTNHNYKDHCVVALSRIKDMKIINVSGILNKVKMEEKCNKIHIN